MIRPDTNLLTDLVAIGSPQVGIARDCFLQGATPAASAVDRPEFRNRTHTRGQKHAIHAILDGKVVTRDDAQSRHGSRPYHHTGRRRGRRTDCTIAAAAILQRMPIATLHPEDCVAFVPFGLNINPISNTRHTLSRTP